MIGEMESGGHPKQFRGLIACNHRKAKNCRLAIISFYSPKFNWHRIMVISLLSESFVLIIRSVYNNDANSSIIHCACALLFEENFYRETINPGDHRSVQVRFNVLLLFYIFIA